MSTFFWDNQSFDDIVVEGPVIGQKDVFIAKLDSSGVFQWVRELPGLGSISHGNQDFLKTDNEGNVCFAGKFKGNINWGDLYNTVSTGITNDAVFLNTVRTEHFFW